MRTKLGYAIAGAIGVGILGIGAWFLADPAGAGAGFGVPAPPADDPYLAVKGVRDVGAGLVMLTLLAAVRGPDRRRTVGLALLAFSTIPFGDAVIVLSRDGSPLAGLGVHGATAAIMVVGAGALLSRSRGRQESRAQALTGPEVIVR
ncbi:DUF4267 domain-containing protein [Pseudonocardia sp. TRM90224]|uniref:DUF4267 domain-containing protein n=1 Tax=Pseudonocardia sp. TRM90224 TaxID=2812678 RepID=UPI001E4013D5|nr:DUF4267 domain-containing protein [Pseudonocardia sp. TRM90224]